MSSTAQSYLNALLALSGNPLLDDTRRSLFAKIGDSELTDVIKRLVAKGIPRNTLEKVASNLLDAIAGEEGNVDRNQLVNDNGKIGEQGQAGRAGAGDGDGRTLRLKIRRQKELKALNTGPMSLRNGKRYLPSSVQPPRKRKAAYTTSKETDAEHASGNEQMIGPSETEDKVDQSGDESSDTDASSWKNIQKNSMMIDLDMYESDDERDVDYTEDETDSETPLNTGAYRLRDMFIKIPNIKIALWVPSDRGPGAWKNFSDLPMAMVVSLVEKFNRDFLMGQDYRRTYQGMIRRKKTFLGYNACVGTWLRSMPKIPNKVYREKTEACRECIGSRQLCAKLVRPEHETGDEIKLAFYPLPRVYRRNADWSSMAYWVCK